MSYIPEPIDTSGVSLEKELLQLAELLAKNNHELWARGRMAQGWKYGPARRDDIKEHPCLVPYEDLPEEEKVYDRVTSLETLKVVCVLGYRVSKDSAAKGE